MKQVEKGGIPCTVVRHGQKGPWWYMNVGRVECGLEGDGEGTDSCSGEYLDACGVAHGGSGGGGGGGGGAVGRIGTPGGAHMVLDGLVPLAGPAGGEEGEGDRGAAVVGEQAGQIGSRPRLVGLVRTGEGEVKPVERECGIEQMEGGGEDLAWVGVSMAKGSVEKRAGLTVRMEKSGTYREIGLDHSTSIPNRLRFCIREGFECRSSGERWRPSARSISRQPGRRQPDATKKERRG